MTRADNLQALFRDLFAAWAMRGPNYWPWHETDSGYCLDAPELIPTGEVRPWGPIYTDREQNYAP